MASDRQQWRQAHEKWLGLLRDKSFSALPALGQTAIICATYSSEGSSVDSFRAEAYALAASLRYWGARPNVILGPTAGDITTVIQDPNVVSMHTIGDGTLSSLILGPKTTPPSPENYYSWKHASDATTHLKLGVAEQRQSGLMQRHLNVPLCLPIMADHRNVLAYVGRYPLTP